MENIHNLYSCLSLRFPEKHPDCIRLKEGEEVEGAEAEAEDALHGALPAPPAGWSITIAITFTMITIGRIAAMGQGAAVEAARKSGVEVKIHRIHHFEIEKIETS